MEKLLRQCYGEAGIKAVNATVLENRTTIMKEIIDNDFLEYEDYLQLTDWVMGIAKEPEELLIQLEERFCENDPKFSIHNSEYPGEENKEIRMLCEALLYEYCECNREEYALPLRIICGINIQRRISSHILEQKFKQLIAEKRVEERKAKDLEKLQTMSGLTKIKKAIQEAEANEQTYELSTDSVKNIIKEIELCEKNIRNIEENQDIYYVNMRAKSEETNILWWMINEWCEPYGEVYRNLKSTEVALAIPLELYMLLEFQLYPYATEQIIQKMLSVTNDFSSEQISLLDIIKGFRDELTDANDIDIQNSVLVEKVQPVLYALNIRMKTENEEEQKALFKVKYGYNASELKMTAKDFAVQLCREIDLLMNM
jgi:hypothetical protein